MQRFFYAVSYGMLRSMADVVPIFREKAHETPEQAVLRKRKDTLSLLSVYAHMAAEYGDYLERHLGPKSKEAKDYGLGGMESCFLAWSCWEGVDEYYRYHPLHTESHRRTSELYRQDVHERYEKKLRDLTEKMTRAGLLPEPGVNHPQYKK
ncbi:MAG: hypothetical protein DI626_11330 [Micavibrio aeruginosavorus]|uniref:Uncharacterized protein n=1 Tax=Micavibrio aeruginosavorus TaxID=349221 RepID=A0A2W5BAX4_9BACT|nr:MAG: hypothetical protein DI626_11330 [Micavibrio aeruginosavorus]